MNQTKMEGGTERHLPKTDDWQFPILLQTKNTVFLFENFNFVYIFFVSFLRLTMLTCGPDNANRLS